MENDNKNQLTIWKLICLVLAAAAFSFSFLYYKQKNNGNVTVPVVEPNVETSEDWLSLWNDDATAKKELVAFMEDITNESSPNYIPVEKRVAVFDLDGTLFCETDPIYFDHMFFMHRALDDPDHTASEFEMKVVKEVQKFIDTGEYPEGLDNLHGQGVASAFKGMSVKQFYDYVAEFGKTPCPGYNNMTIGNAFYLPMLEIVDYLQNNDFKVYIVSGTDRLIVRGAVQGLSFLNIPNNQIIGSDELLVASHQEGADGLDYVFTNDDDLILAGEFIIKNLKMNKVTVIAQEIGIQPVLSFGNSSGDYSMANYTVNNNQYRSLAFMLCCDDTVRENGNESKAAKMVEACEKNGWIAVSMKNDWKTIYGDEVTRK